MTSPIGCRQERSEFPNSKIFPSTASRYLRVDLRCSVFVVMASWEWSTMICEWRYSQKYPPSYSVVKLIITFTCQACFVVLSCMFFPVYSCHACDSIVVVVKTGMKTCCLIIVTNDQQPHWWCYFFVVSLPVFACRDSCVIHSCDD